MIKRGLILVIGLILLASFAYAGYQYDGSITNLVAYYTFEDAGIEISSTDDDFYNNAVGIWQMNNDAWDDISLANNNGFYVGGVSFTDSRILGTYAGNFDGIDDFVNISDHGSLDLSDSGTIAGWIKPNVLGSSNPIVTKSWCDGAEFAYSFQVQSDGKLKWVWDADGDCTTVNSYLTNNSVLFVGGWQHIAVVFSDTSVKLYVDGQEKAGNLTGSYSSIKNSNQPLRIGASRLQNGSFNNFNGSIDELGIWVHELNDSSIETLYNRGIVEDTVGNNDGGFTDAMPSASGGKVDSALGYDGVKGFARLAELDTFAGADEKFTISAWINRDSIGGDRHIVSKIEQGCGGPNQSEFSFMLDNLNHLKFTYYFDTSGNDYREYTLSNPALTSTSDWYHVVVTYDGSIDTNDGDDRIEFYVNGGSPPFKSRTGINGPLGDIPNGTAFVGVGKNLRHNGVPCGAGEFFDGEIDEVMVWDKVLTLSEVEGLYRRGVAPVITDTQFTSAYGTTDWTAVVDFENLSNMVLANNYGSIVWNNNVDVFDDYLYGHVWITSQAISVNSTSSFVDPSLNTSANLTLEGADCNFPDVYYSDAHTKIAAEIYSKDQVCTASTDPACTNIECSSGILTFTVSHFTGFSTGGNSNLTINDTTESGPVAPNSLINFYAYYVNSTSGTPITDALGQCNITISSIGVDNVAMNYVGPHWNYSTNALAASTTWGVNCTSPTYNDKDTTDLVLISSTSSGVPEFSDYAIILLVLVVVGGFFFMRRNQS